MDYSAEEKQNIFIERTKREYPREWSFYEELISHEKFTADEMAAYNFSKRQEIVRYAYENTKFYREYYDAHGFRPDDLKTEDDWCRIPCIGKQTIKENFADMVVGGPDGEFAKKRGKPDTTGGSTAEPTTIYKDYYGDHYAATMWRARGWWAGRKLGELVGPVPVIGQNEGFITRGQKTEEEITAENDLYFPTHRMHMPAQDMSDENIRAFVDNIRKYKPKYLSSYTGALVEFASYCTKHHLDVHIENCIGFACVLTPAHRRVIKEGLHCNIFDNYGASEAFCMALQGEADDPNLYVQSDIRHLDILDDQYQPVKDGETGCVYLTSLTNKVMPFIKFDLGDRTRWINDDKTILPFPRIAPIEGRQSMVLHDNNGGVFFPAVVFGQNYVSEALDMYQCIEHRPGEVTLLMVPNKQNPIRTDLIERIKHDFESNFGHRANFRFEIVDSIAHTQGKLHTIIYEK